MSILNVNQIQPVGGGSTITVSASDISASGSTITVNTLVGDVTGNVTGNLTGNVTSSSTSTFSSGLNVTGGVTVATGATISGSTNTITALTNGSERVRIDSSGRMLLGVNSTSQTTTFIAQGSSSGAANAAVIRLARGTDSPVDSNTLGVVYFTDSNHGDSSAVYAARDGGTWTSGASEPTRLVFATTADGASTMSERARITSTGNVQIANGNLVFSTAGTGIDFSAASGSAAGSTSALLDDYEEGTWTPTTTQFAEYTSNGRYTKIGRIVYIEGVITRNTTTTPNAVNLQAQSLPFTVNNISSVVSGNYWLDEGGPSQNQGDSVGSIYFTSTTVFFVRPTDPSNQSSARYVQADEVTNNRGVSFYGWYRV